MVEVVGPESALRGVAEAITEPVWVGSARSVVKSTVTLGVAEQGVRLKTARSRPEDVLRGFALFGVLLGNFSSMLTNNVPQAIIDAHTTRFDQLLNELHDIFIQISNYNLITI